MRLSRILPGTLVLLGTCLSLALAVAAADDRVERLPADYKRWLERDVGYIITDRERDVFLELTAKEERDQFIEAFWRKRDPNRATVVNEFREEHYARLEHADRELGRDTFREGWQTDRGRFYIILGKPREVQTFEGSGQIVATELWFYEGDTSKGLPSFFYLMFFKRENIGEYRLYDPVADGPQALLTSSQYVPGYNAAAAVRELGRVSPELATASLAFDTAETPDLVSGRPSLSNAMVIARIEDSPKRLIRTEYADAWLRYGDRVSAEYSFNFVPSRSTFALLAEGGVSLVHVSVEIDPENFTLEANEAETQFYTTLDVTLEARRTDGLLVLSSTKEVALQMTASEVEQVRALPFAYQDDFPLVPGRYTVSAIVRNRVSSQYTVAEAELEVPELSAGAPRLVDLLLAYETRPAPGVEDALEVNTFQLGELRLQPASDSVFSIGDTAELVAQVHAPEPGQRVVFELVGPDGVLERLETSVPENGLAVDYLRLDEVGGGTYSVRARLVSPSGEELSSVESRLVLSPRSDRARPGFFYRTGVDTRIPGVMGLILGEQYWNVGELDAAKRHLRQAVESGNPRVWPARWKLANIFLQESEPDETLSLLEPIEDSHADSYEVVAGLGFGRYLKGELERAIGYLERAQQLRAPDILLLNALGDSHEQLGHLDRAREAYRRSLELEPAQPAVEQRLASLGSTEPN